MGSRGHFILSVLDFPISVTASLTGCQASRSTVSWGGIFQTQFHHMRKNLGSTGDPDEICRTPCSVCVACYPGSAGRHLSSQQDPQTVLKFSLSHSCFAGRVLQTSCLLHFLKLALTAKNRVWSQNRTSPAFLSTLGLGRKGNERSRVPVSSGAAPAEGRKGKK